MNKIYFPNLNGIRLIAALSVMIYHFFGENVLNGHFGVVLFFVLSGFLITYLLLQEHETYNKISIRKFYGRRLLRIWPLYFFILIISTLVFFYSGNQVSKYLETLPYYLFFIPNIAFVLNIGLKYAGVLWSVGAEEQFYLIWPWLIQKIDKKNIIILFFFILIFWTFMPHFIDYINYNYLANQKYLQITSKIMGRMGFSAMATGAIVAYFAKYQIDNLKLIFNKPIQIIVLLIVILIWTLNLLPHTAITDQIYSFLFAIIIANFALNPKVIFSLENIVFNYLGKISFGLYVYHLIAFDLVNTILIKLNIELFNIFEFILSFTVTVIFSTLSYYIIEKPFLKIKVKKLTVIDSGNDISKDF